ncbi:MAG: family 78 glycoside hydrolase catalytic domain [Candidatus Brocadiia bacterium]
MSSQPTAPFGLTCELLQSPEKTVIHAPNPVFGWIVGHNTIQSAYRILVGSNVDLLSDHTGDIWDSGKVASNQSINIRHAGSPLDAEVSYHWKVMLWDQNDQGSDWSEIQTLHTGNLTEHPCLPAYPLVTDEVPPHERFFKEDGHCFIDFGKACFGTVSFTCTCEAEGKEVVVHLGEMLEGARTVARRPPGCIRYRKIPVKLREGRHSYRVAIPPDERNTGPLAIKMPPEVGEVLPFRYSEIEGLPPEHELTDVKQLCVHYPFDPDAAEVDSSNETLDAVWDLCKHSIKATSFCGLYVDGDRERIPYEGDAYVNQLSHYAVDRKFTLARNTHEYLIDNATWFTDWYMHSVFMAWQDYMYTGNLDSLASRYRDLQAKTLRFMARDDGLLTTAPENFTESFLKKLHAEKTPRDLVDWPPANFGGGGEPGERDGYDMRPVNTVVNSYHYKTLVQMSDIAQALEKPEDAGDYRQQAKKVRSAINGLLLDRDRGVYLDGEGSDHASLHANMYPLAVDIVPREYVDSVISFVKLRGMACSVFGAQRLLEALYEHNEADYAFELLTAKHDRSWWHMIELGSTVTLEAWDLKYKHNLDWNHAWGAVPANIIQRYLIGVRPLEPGFRKMIIQPRPAALSYINAKVPTIRGSVGVVLKRNAEVPLSLQVEIPGNTKARILLPRLGRDGESVVKSDGTPVEAEDADDFLALDPVGPGRYSLTVETK